MYKILENKGIDPELDAYEICDQSNKYHMIPIEEIDVITRNFKLTYIYKCRNNKYVNYFDN